MSTIDFEPIIREHCPNLLSTNIDTSHLPEPQGLGADNTRRLMTHAYGMDLNGYNILQITSTVNELWNVTLVPSDIEQIISSIDLEARIASITVGA
jgi:hypothetical protein